MGNSCIRRSSCRLCGSESLIKVVSLESTPPANSFIGPKDLEIVQERFPLELFFCKKCAHLQLTDVVNPSKLFENYVYVSGTSPTFVKHFEDYASTVISRFSPSKEDQIIDIGSNDGTLLSFFQKHEYKVIGIDPAQEIAKKATDNGIETIPEFFTEKLANKIFTERGAASVITANNVFAHADDLKGIIQGIKLLLNPSGIFVFEVSYLVDVFEKTLFDTIYHEHLAYHSVGPLIKFFQANGMELIEVERVDTHGGSLRGFAQLSTGPRPIGPSVERLLKLEKDLELDKSGTFQGFESRINSIKVELTRTLKGLKAQGKKIAGFGAPAKATTLMYQFGLGPDLIDFIVDDSPLKQGLFTPGLHIPVLPSSAIQEKSPDYLLILAWNFAKPIMQKNSSFHNSGGKFIIPLPKVEVV